MTHQLDRLVLQVPSLSEDCPCAEAYDRFAADEDLLTLAVTRDALPVGIIDRNELLFQLAQNFGRALYGRKAISQLMDSAPLIVDVGISITTLNRIIVQERPSALLKGFIITENDRYLGVGTALSLLNLTVEDMTLRAEELAAAQQRAQTANLAKSNFLASMSHELRTPLNAIIGFSELIAHQSAGPDCSPDDTPRFREYAEDIRASGAHLLGVINDVLDVAKIEAGHAELNETLLAPHRLIERCLRMVEPRAAKTGIEISVDCDETLPVVRGDETKIQQVLLNILSNAVKFTSPGGRVAIEAETSPTEGMTIAIADTGIGISDRDLERITEPFVQVDSELNRKFEGTGLGLHLARSFMTLHGGSLQIESHVGIGTRVEIHFPAARLLLRAA
ncbi:sensor histidine kinase [Denitrobaculum tricleocarpae]|uniref:histidine kinase n=1 Tax=Denitrobaculum tricleocarpae TaxID=2591009 RepID=A0A545TL69_9PROT|nr:HAMP domain-containing sensor histidine kinase [Denitrobaculum tricleocarpae]TQV77948.1 HAMP domain-containing histidine kinase [Denitrobaculum tricleocarpae]